MLKLKMIGVKHALTCCYYCKSRKQPKNFECKGLANGGSYIKRESTLLRVETNLVILPEPRWHGFLENLV